MFKRFIAALENGEDFMLRQLYKYAANSEYAQYTGARKEEWRVTLREPAKMLAEYARHNTSPDPFHLDSAYDHAPASEFGILVVKRHRERGVRFDMFLGMFKVVRNVFTDLIHSELSRQEEIRLATVVSNRFFDNMELGFASEWIQNTDVVRELQDNNRRMTSENNRYLTIFNSIAEPAFVLDENKIVLEANRAFCDYFSVTSETIVGKACHTVISSDLCGYCPVLEATRLGKPVRNRETHLNINGEQRTCLITCAPLDDISRKKCGVIVVMRDITQMVAMQERIQQKERLEAIGRLAGGVAHDFNNQLSTVLGFTDLLLKKLDNPECLRYLSLIYRAASRSKELTQQLLAYSRQGLHRNVEINIHQTITELVEILSRTFDKSVTVGQKLSALKPVVMGEPTQIQNALLNLAINARDSMPNGGSLTLETSDFEGGADNMNLLQDLDLAPGPYLKVCISDTGFGIAPGIIDKIFEPFFTTKPFGQGTGLGLASVYGTMKNHNGAVEVSSEPGKGSVFSLYFPVDPHRNAEKTNCSKEDARACVAGN